jgi:hypothetical protein
MRRTILAAAGAFALSATLPLATAAQTLRGVTDTEIVIGTYTDLSGVTVAWGVNNSGSHLRRAAFTGIAFGGTNVIGLASVWSFKPNESPRYTTGTSLGLTTAVIFTTLPWFVMWNARRINRKRDAELAALPAGHQFHSNIYDDTDVRFRCALARFVPLARSLTSVAQVHPLSGNPSAVRLSGSLTGAPVYRLSGWVVRMGGVGRPCSDATWLLNSRLTSRPPSPRPSPPRSTPPRPWRPPPLCGRP